MYKYINCKIFAQSWLIIMPKASLSMRRTGDFCKDAAVEMSIWLSLYPHNEKLIRCDELWREFIPFLTQDKSTFGFPLLN